MKDAPQPIKEIGDILKRDYGMKPAPNFCFVVGEEEAMEVAWVGEADTRAMVKLLTQHGWVRDPARYSDHINFDKGSHLGSICKWHGQCLMLFSPDLCKF